jgi:hypothetical protein
MKHSTPEVRRMWPGGPLRRWSPTSTALCSMGRSGGSFTGAYVCDKCRVSVDGIYFVCEAREWLCATCRKAAAMMTTVILPHTAQRETM